MPKQPLHTTREKTRLLQSSRKPSCKYGQVANQHTFTQHLTMFMQNIEFESKRTTCLDGGKRDYVSLVFLLTTNSLRLF